MSNMVGNKYHDIANNIIAERDKERGAVTTSQRPEQRMHPDERYKQDGSEVGHAFDMLSLAASKLGGEDRLYQLPLSEAAQAIGWTNFTPEEEAFYNSLDPQGRRDIMHKVAESDGLGRISSFMNEQTNQGHMNK